MYSIVGKKMPALPEQKTKRTNSETLTDGMMRDFEFFTGKTKDAPEAKRLRFNQDSARGKFPERKFNKGGYCGASNPPARPVKK